MEEKYSFLEKQIAVQNLIKKKIKKQYLSDTYPKFQLKNESKTCLYCESVLTGSPELKAVCEQQEQMKTITKKLPDTRSFGPDGSKTSHRNNLFCSVFCKEVYYSINKMFFPKKYKKTIKCVPFELLTTDSKITLKNLINENNLDFDKINLYYNDKRKNDDSSPISYRKIILKAQFIKKYKIIKSVSIELSLKIFKIKKNVLCDLPFINCMGKEVERFRNLQLRRHEVPSERPPEGPTEGPCTDMFYLLKQDDTQLSTIDNMCLYCKEKLNNNNKYFIDLGNNYVLGNICSYFCYKVYVSYAIEYINYPYKYFYNIPPLSLFATPNDILQIKNKNNLNRLNRININNENIIYETEILNNEIEINEIKY